jgi:hypothetical protein
MITKSETKELDKVDRFCRNMTPVSNQRCEDALAGSLAHPHQAIPRRRKLGRQESRGLKQKLVCKATSGRCQFMYELTQRHDTR